MMQKTFNSFLFCVFWLPIGAYCKIIIIITKYCKQGAFFSQKSILRVKITFFYVEKMQK